MKAMHKSAIFSGVNWFVSGVNCRKLYLKVLISFGIQSRSSLKKSFDLFSQLDTDCFLLRKIVIEFNNFVIILNPTIEINNKEIEESIL